MPNITPQHLHIISFDIPWPANYGGVIDVYYKALSLSERGVRIHLHCFEYGRARAKELEAICESVHYYKRHTGQRQLFMKKPYIAVTRQSEELISSLLRDDHPILFEGLHTCMPLNDTRLKGRHMVVRTHNIEHDYYRALAEVERNPFKRYYFSNEADKLRRFERILRHAQGVAAISIADAEHFATQHPNVQHITAFHPNREVESQAGKGEYCLYHGNLEVGENNQAALHLVRNIFANTDIPLIIAGNRPSRELRAEAAKHSHVQLRINQSTEAIHNLIRHAQVNVLPTFQSTGIKLKLLAALYMGRHCLVNGPMVENTGLEPLCRVEDSDRRYTDALKELFDRSFTDEDIKKREQVLLDQFSNRSTAEKLLQLLFPSNH